MEFLKGILTDETYAKVQEELKGKEVKLADLSKGEYVSKGKFDTVQAKIDTLEQKVKDRDTQITELSKVDAKELQARIEAANAKNAEDAKAWETEKQNYEKQLADINLNNAMRAKLQHAKDPEDIIRQIDRSKISLDNGNLLGFDEQLKPIQENKSYLFNDSTDTGSPANPAGAEPTDPAKGLDNKMISAIWGGITPPKE